ncbi:protein phosphatase 1 regulatory subunit 37 [Neopsephotus bourkii]|uniref:protein phosphatase 1 regulatory subunit 37 n=1 Tax=Neopsephotus bourkii TaxID=309878 RepID=UPI002AA5B6BE|nr:protein phosphatase 1 regulatory subunit 37 [Neopsephotus bourkii]
MGTGPELLLPVGWVQCRSPVLRVGFGVRGGDSHGVPSIPCSQTNCLQYLDARNTPLLDHSAPFVARALRISSSLVVLHLENASLSGRPLLLLATALKMNMNLRELYLADNKLNGLQDSAQLGNLLKFNCSIQILDLRNNHILDSGLAYICEGLKEQRKGLVTLVLWNNQLTHAGMAYLGMTLPHTQSLETLNLGHNPIGNEGVRNLKNGLIGNRSVLRLGLASTKLTCEGAVAVAEFIAESPRLLRLDLRENDVKTGGLMALSLALKVNHSLLRLDLDREPKKEAVKSFIETQKALLGEIQNGCKRNFILAKEKEEQEQQLQQSASMAEIAMAEPLEEAPAEPIPDGSPGSTREEEEAMASENGATEPTERDQERDNDRDEGTDSDTDEDEDAAPSERKELNDSTDGVLMAPSIPEDAPIGNAPSQGHERRISVSSPGRGHKVFVVTRVEPEPDEDADPSGNTEPCANGAEALPNGLKVDFARALPDVASENDGKMGSCGAEHELSCSKNEQELEELLLEASQDTGQELP